MPNFGLLSKDGRGIGMCAECVGLVIEVGTKEVET